VKDNRRGGGQLTNLSFAWNVAIARVRVTAAVSVAGGSRGDGRQLRQLQLYRHEMQHFVRVLHEYIASEVVTVSWHEFEADLSQHLAGVDDLRQRHLNYLHKCRFRSEPQSNQQAQLSDSG